MTETIMVVPRTKLFEQGYFTGFTTKDYTQPILNNYEWKNRTDVETNPDYKQPIPYILVRKDNEIFAYQRGEANNEGRLQEMWSWGVGGHIEQIDQTDNPLKTGMIRELHEEIDVEPTTINTVGFINYDDDDVGKVHIGVLYEVITDEEVIPKDAEIGTHGFFTKKELREMINSSDKSVETWSRILLDNI